MKILLLDFTFNHLLYILNCSITDLLQKDTGIYFTYWKYMYSKQVLRSNIIVSYISLQVKGISVADKSIIMSRHYDRFVCYQYPFHHHFAQLHQYKFESVPKHFIWGQVSVRYYWFNVSLYCMSYSEVKLARLATCNLMHGGTFNSTIVINILTGAAQARHIWLVSIILTWLTL